MYYYLTHYKTTINTKQYLCIRLLYLDLEKHISVVVNNYKEDDKETDYFLSSLNCFDEVTQHISFKVRQDGKISTTFNV